MENPSQGLFKRQKAIFRMSTLWNTLWKACVCDVYKKVFPLSTSSITTTTGIMNSSNRKTNDVWYGRHRSGLNPFHASHRRTLSTPGKHLLYSLRLSYQKQAHRPVGLVAYPSRKTQGVCSFQSPVSESHPLDTSEYAYLNGFHRLGSPSTLFHRYHVAMVSYGAQGRASAWSIFSEGRSASPYCIWTARFNPRS